jgi:hypothetical protein
MIDGLLELELQFKVLPKMEKISLHILGFDV